MRAHTTSEAENNAPNGKPSLWVRFTQASTQDEYFNGWLALQCSLIPNVIQGVLVMGQPDSGSFVPVSKWPEEEDAERLAEVSERALSERCGLLVELSRPAGADVSITRRYGAAYPILIDGCLHGVVAVEVAVRSQGQLTTLMEQLQWGVAWLELLFRRRRVAKDGAALARLKSAVDLLARTLAEEHFEGAGMAFVTELAMQLKCDRVSLGFVHRNHVRVQAISHSAQFSERMKLIRAIGMAMDEAIVQRREILYPVPQNAEALVTRDHEHLAKHHGLESILTIPFYGNGRYYGSLTLERPGEHPFSEDEVEFCRSAAALAAPALEGKRLHDRLLIRKIADSFQRQVVRFFGPRYVGRKLAGLLVVALVVFFSIATGEYRVTANTTLEGAVRRVVAAPFRGYVKEARVRAGDVVHEGMLICNLDDRDLSLQRLNWLNQRTQFERQYQAALAEHNRAQVEIIKAQLDQARAQLNLVESQMERTRIHAPFEGIVVSGDLSQRLGGVVEQGEVLFEIAPLDVYRVILKVDERRIGDVREGQRGSLVLSSLPHRHFDFVVDKITPISLALEGHNYFRVEARLQAASEHLRPGMEGVGKISVDRRRLISIWTRDLTEWLRLWAWSWWR